MTSEQGALAASRRMMYGMTQERVLCQQISSSGCHRGDLRAGRHCSYGGTRITSAIQINMHTLLKLDTGTFTLYNKTHFYQTLHSFGERHTQELYAGKRKLLLKTHIHILAQLVLHAGVEHAQFLDPVVHWHIRIEVDLLLNLFQFPAMSARCY